MRPLQRQQAALGHGHNGAAAANARLDVGDVAHLAGAVDDHEQVSAPVDEHQVVDDGALFGEQQAIALLAYRQADHVDRHQRFEGGGGIGAFQAQLPHVRDVEQAGGPAGVVVLGHQAGGVLHRHGVAGKGHHAGAQFEVQRMQGRALQGGILGGGQAGLRGQSCVPWW